MKKKILKICIFSILLLVANFSTNYATDSYYEISKIGDRILFQNGNFTAPSTKNINHDISYGVNNIFLFNLLAESNLPDKYSIQEDCKVNVYEQTGETCWIYSTNSILETTDSKENNKKIEYNKFDVNSTDYDSAKIYNRTVNSGGNPLLALNFYTCGNGPKTTMKKEIDTKIGDYICLSNIIKGKDATGKTQYNNGQYTEKEVELVRNKIKEHIKEHGAVTSSMYSKGKEYFSDTKNYFNSESYYCDYNYNFSGVNQIIPDHQITIIGWDDKYKKENFNPKHQPKNDGAYIVLNSWGTGFSGDGIFYISYEDTFIESSVYGAYNVKEKEYDNLYQHDELGISNIIGFREGVNYGANVFTRTTREKELLTEVSIANLVDSAYEIYVNKESGDLDFNKFEKVAETELLEAGYHTINLEEEVVLSGDKFVIAVKYKNIENGITHFGVEYTNEKELKEIGQVSAWKNAVINKGESFIYGEKIGYWGDIKDIFSGANISEENRQTRNLCIKGFTQKYKSEVQTGDFKLTLNGYDIKDNYILHINSNTTKTSFLNNIESNAENVTIYEAENEIEKDDIIKTGMIIELTKEGKELEYILVVTGDSTGDGKVNASDLISAVKQYKYDKTNGKKGKKLSGEHLLAIKFTNSSIYSAQDLIGQVREYKRYK